MNKCVYDSNHRFARLRERLAAKPSRAAEIFTLGADGVDARLGGGLARAALHELFAGAPDDVSAAAGFAVMLAIRAGDKPILWVRADNAAKSAGRLYGPGLAGLGADPARLLLVHAPDDLAALRAGADILACPGVGSVIIESRGKAPVIDLTATRRLSLAAARNGVTALLLRSAADPMPSAAETRWQICAAPSIALEANAPGHSRLALTLMRHRGGRAGFETMMEWNHDRQSFREAPLHRDLLPLVERRQMAA